jgi:acetyl-CoA carboxylase biotin carboxyl carrier protein
MPDTPKRAESPIDSRAIRKLAKLLDDTGLTEIEYDTGELRIRVARQGGSVQLAAPAAPAPDPGSPPPLDTIAPSAAAGPDPSHPGAVTSPMVGTVYLAPEPGAPNFVSVGDSVSAGQTLMLVEAMKTFNEIKAQKGGVVREIVVENGAPVEFGEVLAIVE